jgi:amino acid transporter
LAKLHPRFGTPATAVLFTCVLSLVPAFYSAAVIDWVFSAAYIWIILYACFHILALVNRIRHPTAPRAFQGSWFPWASITGFAATLFGLYFAFAGAHTFYGGRALLVLGTALLIAAVSTWTSKRRSQERRSLKFRIREQEITNELAPVAVLRAHKES